MTLPNRYDRYKKLVELHGTDLVRQAGFESASLILTIPEEVKSVSQPSLTAQEGFKRELLDSRIRNNTTPSLRNARSMKSKALLSATSGAGSPYGNLRYGSGRTEYAPRTERQASSSSDGA